MDQELDFEYEERRRRRARRLARQKRRRRQLRIRLAILTVMMVLAGTGLFAVIRHFLPGGSVRVEAAANVSLASSALASSAEQETENTVPAETAQETAGEEAESVQVSPEVSSFRQGYEVKKAENSAWISNEQINSTNIALVNVDTGEVEAERDAFARISPASMTKILTVLVAAEELEKRDQSWEEVLEERTVPSDEILNTVYRDDCSIVGFARGESVTVRDLLYGTILPSGGDAAMTLAEYIAGSQEAFVEKMNQKLEELGLSDTAHFTNCVGVYDENHYCTPADMAMIMKAVIENDHCREILGARTYTTSRTEQHPDGIEISNWFLRRIEDKDTHGTVMGAKTGFVNQAGCCAVSYQVSRNGGHYICVTANAWSSWRCIYDHVDVYSSYTG